MKKMKLFHFLHFLSSITFFSIFSFLMAREKKWIRNGWDRKAFFHFWEKKESVPGHESIFFKVREASGAHFISFFTFLNGNKCHLFHFLTNFAMAASCWKGMPPAGANPQTPFRHCGAHLPLWIWKSLRVRASQRMKWLHGPVRNMAWGRPLPPPLGEGGRSARRASFFVLHCKDLP